MPELPSYDQLMVPLFMALKDLGGSGSIAEIDEKVGERMAMTEEMLEVPHSPEKSNQTEFQYRLAWARTYLKKYGLIDNSSRGVWIISPDKKDVIEFDPTEVVRTVREADRKRRLERVPDDDEEGEAELGTWRERLHRFTHYASFFRGL